MDGIPVIQWPHTHPHPQFTERALDSKPDKTDTQTLRQPSTMTTATTLLSETAEQLGAIWYQLMKARRASEAAASSTWCRAVHFVVHFMMHFGRVLALAGILPWPSGSNIHAGKRRPKDGTWSVALNN